MDDMVREGVASFKLFMAYPDVLMVDDGTIFKALQQTAKNDKKTLTAARLDCEFFEIGNIARSCTATDNSKAVFNPFQPTDKHG